MLKKRQGFSIFLGGRKSERWVLIPLFRVPRMVWGLKSLHVVMTETVLLLEVVSFSVVAKGTYEGQLFLC